jgi:hypothetical protein
MSRFPPDPDLAPITPPPGMPTFNGPPPAASPLGEATVGGAAVVAGAPRIGRLSPAAWGASVALEHAITVDDAPLTTLAISRLTVGDMVDLLMEDEPAHDLSLRVRARMCGVHPAVLLALSADDGERVAEACRPFLPRDIAATETMSAAAEAGPG